MACYCHAMATLQVKNLDPVIHASLVERARREGRTLSDLVTAMLKRELSRPSLEEWMTSLKRGPRLEHDVDGAGVLDADRGPWPDATGG
jgi:post-segregation antitoxin (ccd killing protein)